MDATLFLADLEAKPAALRGLADALAQGNPWRERVTLKPPVLLLGMGIRELSMEASAIAEVKEALGRVTLAEAEAMVQGTLGMVTAQEIESAAMSAFGTRFADLLEAE